MFFVQTLLYKIQRYRIFYLLCSILMTSVVLVSCSGFSLGAGSGPSPTTPSTSTLTHTSTAQQVALASLHWCGKPVLIFRDEGATKSGTSTQGTPTASTGVATPAATPKTITNWGQVEPYLGFTVYLPETLPSGSCLISASGNIHDPTLGGIFTIGYLLPNHDAISFSEAPLLSQSSTFQCSPSTPGAKGGTPTPGPTAEPVQLCTGARDKTNVVLSARGTTSSLQQVFSALQSRVNWVPTS